MRGFLRLLVGMPSSLAGSKLVWAAGLVGAIVVAVGAGIAGASSATLGTSSVGGSFDQGGAGYLDVSGSYSTGGGSISSLQAYVKGETQTLSLRGVVYADSGGHPGSLVAATGEVSVAAGAAGGWVTLPFPASVSLPSGSYWVGYWYGPGTGSGGGGFAYASSSGSEWYASASYSSTSKPPASFPSGASSSSRYSVYATVTATVVAPQNISLPTISGSAVSGQTLTASTGSWSNSPSSYGYQWSDCDSSGNNCVPIVGATGSSYPLGMVDVGYTIRVAVTASNSAGSATATSAQTAVVATAPTAATTSTSSATLGTTSVGGSSEVGGAGYLDLNGPFSLSGSASASKLVAYLAGTGSTGTIRPVIYQSSSGVPGALVAAGPQVSIAANQAAAWVDLPFSSTLNLAAGSYFVGFWYGGNVRVYEGSQSNVESYAPDAYSSTGTPSDPFGSGSASSSLYSVYLPYAAGTSTTTGTGSTGYTFFEDTREGFPKIAAYRPTCGASASQAAQFDWFVTDGYCDSVLDSAVGINPSLLGMIQPDMTGTDNLFAATYGSYPHITSPLYDPAIGTIRAFQSSDWLDNTDGTVHLDGSVNVLDWLSNDTALWSADVVAYWAKQNGALSSAHPGVMGIWGDNDFWSDQGYAFKGTALDPAAVGTTTANANQATWDTNDVAHHDRLASDLPGMVIGGNDVSSYSPDPSAYKGSQANGWLLPGMSSAGMRECADQYFGLYTASGFDDLVTSAQRYLGGKSLDGQQRYLMLNDCNATSTQVNEYALAVATIAGMYYWPYENGSWTTTLSIAPSIPDVTRNGARNWLGFPTAAPQQIASGLWKRTFQHGVVYANMTGSSQTVDGQTIANESGLFVSA